MSGRFAKDAVIGADTVLTPVQVGRFKAAGGQIVVAPNYDSRVAVEVLQAEKAYGSGVGTAIEAFAAPESGATRADQVTQTSRSCRARRNNSALARARSTRVPFFFWIASWRWNRSTIWGHAARWNSGTAAKGEMTGSFGCAGDW